MRGSADPSSEKTYVLGVDGDGCLRGIFADDRVHIAIFGYPGTGKSTLMFSLVLQHVVAGEGFLILDPHGDLALKVLSHIPRHKWKRVVYIDPSTAYGKFRSVVQLNFLEYRSFLEKQIVARMVMDVLEKYYGRYWGPRLDMILLNAIYLLLEGAEGNPSFLDIYNVLTDEDFRGKILTCCRDSKVKRFWTVEFKKMPRDAVLSVMTKIYRLVHEKLIVPIFDCKRSSVNFRKAMDEGLFIIVNLAEGKITSDVANFLGSLILAKVYMAGMAREEIPERQRKPFYVYVDEAYRFTTLSIREILQSLRKYKVFMTLAAQYLGQYRKEVGDSIPSLCNTLICFSVGRETAERLEEFFMPVLDSRELMDLPRYHFVASAIIKGRREVQILKTLDPKEGKNRIDDVIKASLSVFGREVHIEESWNIYSRARMSLPRPPVTPIEYLILKALHEKLLEREAAFPERVLTDKLCQEKGLERRTVLQALHALIWRRFVNVYGAGLLSISENAERRFFLPVPSGPRGGGTLHAELLRLGCSDLIEDEYFLIFDVGAEPPRKVNVHGKPIYLARRLPDVIAYPLYRVNGKIHPLLFDVSRAIAIEAETEPLKYKARAISNFKKCMAYMLPVRFIVPGGLDEALRLARVLKMEGANIVENVKFNCKAGNVEVVGIDLRRHLKIKVSRNLIRNSGYGSRESYL